MSVVLIGITVDRSLNRSGYPHFEIPEAYCDSIIKTGGTPILIPPDLPNNRLRELLNRLDGILFSGGGDIEPARYGSPEHPRVASVDPDRDRLEIELLHHVTRLEMPFLGICRGLQLINVAFGGTLYEDLTDQFSQKIRHDQFPTQPRDYLAHPVEIINDSRLAKIIGKSEIRVNSLHHQGIRRLADNLIASAYAPDGLVEGIEIPNYPFGLAVQWHPECLLTAPPAACQRYSVQAARLSRAGARENRLTHPQMRNLFRSFVEAARSYQQKR